MVLSGALSTMNIWVEKIEDIRYSLNDLYMILLMSGWMFLFMGLYYKEMLPTFLGGVLAAGSFLAIRTQYGVSEADYVRGMIPHHSMAVHMSNELLKKKHTLTKFLQNIVTTQRREIDYMKQN
jgi:uncharacterized protein (DUF305 family)